MAGIVRARGAEAALLSASVSSEPYVSGAQWKPEILPPPIHWITSEDEGGAGVLDAGLGTGAARGPAARPRFQGRPRAPGPASFSGSSVLARTPEPSRSDGTEAFLPPALGACVRRPVTRGTVLSDVAACTDTFFGR